MKQLLTLSSLFLALVLLAMLGLNQSHFAAAQSMALASPPLDSATSQPHHALPDNSATDAGQLGTWECWDDGSPDPCRNMNLNSVKMLSATDGWAVGGDDGDDSDSMILHWDGSSWSEVTSPTTNELNSVDMVNSNDGWAVGDDGTILRWDGSSWSDVTSPITNTLRSLDMVSSTDGWAVGGDGTILHWDGSSWSDVTSPTDEWLNSGDGE